MHLHIKKKEKKREWPCHIWQVTYDKSYDREKEQEIQDMLLESVNTIQFYPVKVTS